MIKEIGSHFWIKPNEDIISKNTVTPEIFGIKGEDFSLVSTGRSAIEMAINNIELNEKVCKIAVVPSYTCESVIFPFFKMGYKIYTYEINEDFTVDYYKLYEKIRKVKAKILLLHRYFGFDTLRGIEDLIPKLKELGVYIIEDRTQCLYSDIKVIDADYWIGSIRKWSEVPDGGFIVSRKGEIAGKPTETDKELEKTKIKASYMKYDYLFNNVGRKEDYLYEYNKAEQLIEKRKTPFSLSDTSITMLSNMDMEHLKRKRRENFIALVNGLKQYEEIILPFSKLKEEEVPLYCPIRVKNRKAIQKYLINNEIYAPIIWTRPLIGERIYSNVEILYKELLSIPIDQRYDKENMNRIVKNVGEILTILT